MLRAASAENASTHVSRIVDVEAGRTAPRLGDLSRFIAALLGEPEHVIAHYVRRLRIDRELPASSRGVSNVGGAVATPRHAAVLLAALLGTRVADNATKAVRETGAYECTGQSVFPAAAWAASWYPAGDNRPTLIDYIEQEITARFAPCEQFSNGHVLMRIALLRARSINVALVDGLVLDDGGVSFSTRTIFAPPGIGYLPTRLNVWASLEDMRAIPGCAIDALARFFREPAQAQAWLTETRGTC